MILSKPSALLIPALVTLAGCGEPGSPAAGGRAPAPRAAADGPPGLPDEARARGLDFVNRSGTAAKHTVLEANGGGVAVLDLGADGDLDLVFAQGLSSLEALATGPAADLTVFENDGHGRFTRAPGPRLSGWWTGLAAGDVNGDGRSDLIAGGFGALVCLLQSADGRLEALGSSGLEPVAAERVTIGEERAVGRIPSWVTSLALFDADGDGALDLYVGRYLELDPLDPPRGALGEGELALPCRWKGHDVFCGPRGLVPQSDLLYFGRGDGRFRDGTAEALPQNLAAGFTLGVRPFDADMDGDTDLYVAADSAPNQLFVNLGDGRFLERARRAGVALSQDGRPEAGMGVTAGDVNRDGLFDLAVTNFSAEPTELYFGTPEGFTNESFRTGLASATRALLSWGTHLEDLDGDGWLELFTANGHVYPQADLEYTGTSYGQRDTLWRLAPRASDGRVRATLVEPSHPDSILAPELGTRGSAIADLDGDGAPDLVLNRIDSAAALGMNRMGRENRRLVLRLIGDPATAGPDGRRTPRDAIGTRVAVVVDGAERAFLDEVQTADGYQSASSPELYFGLGGREHYDELRVLWASGLQQVFPGGATDRALTLREGSDEIEAREL